MLSDEFNGAYVQVDGDGEVIDLPDAVEPLVDYLPVASPASTPTGRSTGRRWWTRASA